jgi:colanic acid biosynthesis glycosyl transferase WcaI
MRIVFFNRSYWPDTGATGQLLTELAEDLVASHGCEVTIITGYPIRETQTLPVEDERRGVRIVRAAGTKADPRRFVGRATNYMTYFASACLAALRVRDADVVVAMTDPPIIGLAARLAARRSGAKFVFLCEDVFPEVTALLEDFRSDIVDSMLGRISRYLLGRADAIVALGDTMKARLVSGKGADPSRIAVIHNWADCKALAPGAKDNGFARAHGLRDRFVVMHAGNIGLSQSFDVIVDAAERLRGHDEIRFVLVGDGSKRAALEDDVRTRGLDNVVFVPYQPRERMADSYAAADVFLVTLKPGLSGYIVPSKIYTILASGRPYIAAVEPDSEVVQITREHDCGISVAPGDGAAMADAILRLAGDRAHAARLGERARAAALSFDRPRQVAAYASLFATLTASHAGRDRDLSAVAGAKAAAAPASHPRSGSARA